jgi:hypothetical protein
MDGADCGAGALMPIVPPDPIPLMPVRIPAFLA